MGWVGLGWCSGDKGVHCADADNGLVEPSTYSVTFNHLSSALVLLLPF
jgi:hypothetical protein